MEMVENLESSRLEDLLSESSMKEIDDDSFSSDEESSEYFEAKLITLKWLLVREKQLKIAIDYETLKKEIEVIKDKDLLSEKIAGLRSNLETINKAYIAELSTANKKQFDEISRSIASQKAVHARHRIYSVKQKETIKVLLNKVKELTKQINTEQKEIASMEKRIFKLNRDISNSKKTKKRKIVENGKNAELQKIRSENKQLFDRTQLLADITQSLVAHHLFTSPSSDTNNLLPPLEDVCVRIRECHLDDSKNMWDLLNVLKSAEI